MEYLIVTIVIMLFCITALLQEKSPGNAIMIPADKSKALKPVTAPVKPVKKHPDGAVFVPFISLSKFTGMLCYDVIPIHGGRPICLYPSAGYGVAGALQLTRYNYQQVLFNAPDNLIRKISMPLYYCYLALLNLFIED